ncbi:MAG: DUF4097 domain-containing protein [Lachnospiraceae bacterium]|nr:DUF4097 domain-containing protein [Lachnospiraceae bacterium]
MKNFVKVSLMAAGILAVTGIILCIVSVAVGGTGIIRYVHNDEYMEKRIEAAEEVFESISESFTHAGSHSNRTHEIVNSITGSDDSSWLEVNGEAYYDGGYEEHFFMENIRKLDLDLGAGTLIIKEKDAVDNTIDIYMQGVGKCSHYIKEGDGTLYVEGFKGITNIIGTNAYENNCITIVLPAGCQFEEVELAIGAGIMEVGNISVYELEATVGAGELVLYDVETNEWSVEVGAGVVEANTMTVRGEADINVNMGSLAFNGSIMGDLDVECGMGNLEMKLTGKETDHNYEIECGAGNVVVGGFSTGTLAAERKINNGSASTFEIECNMGNINIEFQD